MKARDLIGRTLKIIDVETNVENSHLTLVLEDTDKGTKHKLRISEESGASGSSKWFTWAEVSFDGMTIFQT